MHSRFIRSEFSRNLAVLMTGTALAQALPILVSPFLTRLYSPEEFGVLAGFLAIVNIVSVIASGQYELAVVLPESDKDATALTCIGIMLALFISALVFFIVGVFIFNDYIPNWLVLENKWMMFLFPILILFTAGNNILSRNLTRFKKYKIMAHSKVAWQISNNTLKLVLGALNYTGIGLFVGTIIGFLVSIIFQTKALFSSFMVQAKDLELKDLIRQAKRYKKFPLVSSWGALMNVASVQIPVLLFTTLFSSEIAGFFSLSNKIVSIPMIFIGASISQVFMERAAKIKSNKEELKDLTLSIFNKLLLIGTIGLSVITFYGDLIFPLVFGDEWFQAGKYSQWISIWRIFIFAASPLSTMFFVLEKQGESFIWNFVMLFSRVMIIYLAWTLSFSDLKTVTLFSVVGAFLWVFMSIRILNMAGVTLKKSFMQFFLFFVVPMTVQWLLSIPIRSLILK